MERNSFFLRLDLQELKRNHRNVSKNISSRINDFRIAKKGERKWKIVVNA